MPVYHWQLRTGTHRQFVCFQHPRLHPKSPFSKPQVCDPSPGANSSALWEKQQQASTHRWVLERNSTLPSLKKATKKTPSVLGNEAFDDNNFLNVKSFPLVLRALGNSHRPFVFRKPGLWNSSSNSPWADGSHWEVWEIDLLLFYRLWGSPITCCPITLVTLQALPGDLVAKVTLPWQHESALWELGYCLRCLY